MPPRRAAAVFAALVALATLRPPPVSTAIAERVDRDVFLMGTRARLTTFAPSRTEGLRTLDRALGILEAAEDELSTWRPDSAVSRLNRHPLGRPWQAPASFCRTFRELLDWSERTGGAFDPVVGRLAEAWDLHGSGRIPSEAELTTAREISGVHLFALDPGPCLITRRADATIDVGAFGKGDALDRVADALSSLPWSIDLGGQVTVNGKPAGEDNWRVALADPRDRHRVYMELQLSGGSLATSAGSERDLTAEGRRIGHILDPRTGGPAPFRGSVSVWHERGLVADVLSTALFVMGPEAGLRWAEARDVSACYLVPSDNGAVRMLMTKAFRRLIS